MTRYTPLWQQGGSYAASVDRNLMAALFPGGGAAGALPTVVANTMNVSIPAGRAAVPLQAGANTALCCWDAAEVVTSTSAPASGNSRIDVVVLQVRDPQLDAGVNNDFIFQVLAGAPTTGTPVAPATPANALAVCQYTVPGAVANLNGVTIVDRRGATGPPPVFASTAARDAVYPNPTRGQLAVTVDTDTLWQAIGVGPTWWQLSSAGPATAWSPLGLQNGWTNIGSGYQTAQYRKLGDIVHVRGLIKSGPVPSLFASFGAGFQPPAGIQFAQVGSGNTLAVIEILANGNFSVLAGNNVGIGITSSWSVTA
jgi:hypothetical protein